MRSNFDEQLHQLNKALISMGSMCESAIAKSAKALLQGDIGLARQVPELAAQIDEHEREIERACMKLLLRQQPVARDLRVISSALKMVTDMERVGHQSADIAEIITMGNIAASDDTMYIHDMAMSTIKMVTDSIDAFVQQDVELARAVVAYDDVVDGYFDSVKKTLVERFRDPDTKAEYTLDLLMVAKYFERIGDHAVNIAQWVLFSITGSREDEKA